jgi:CrcB protein
MNWQIIAIALGGALGSVLRFLTANAVYQWLGRDFPYGTLSVNLIGSALIGFLAEIMIGRLSLSAEWRGAVLIGFLGGFTTFSTFSLETLVLLENGEAGKALLNILASVLLCVLAAWGGLILARQL